MKKWAITILLSLAAVGLPPTTTAAQPPSPGSSAPPYLILRPPARDHHDRAYFPGKGYEVRPQSYAYGWFGAQPRTHWKRQTGYNSSYIQWTKQ